MAKTTWGIPDDDVTIPHIIMNKDSIFSGTTLEHYLKALFRSTGATNPYHNLRHSLHVMRSAYLAARYHSDELTAREIRTIVIASMMHDMNHSGRARQESDHLEIPRALYAFLRCVQEEDRESMTKINELISATQFPPTKKEDLTLSEKIIQDADMTQTFSVAWIQQIAVGLAVEWGMTPLQVFQNQKGFLSDLEWKTEWARQAFPPEAIQAKINEAEEFVKMLS